MPSAKILSEKQAYVADLKAKFESAVSGCVVAYGGINVENDTKLRKELREAGVDYMVVKNTMLRLAVKGTSLEGLAEQFKGDTAIAFAHEEDPMSAARILCKYQDGDKSKKFVVKAGFMEGKVMDAAETNAIAKLPNREGMLSMFATARPDRVLVRAPANMDSIPSRLGSFAIALVSAAFIALPSMKPAFTTNFLDLSPS